MLKDVPFMSTWDDVETTVLAIRRVDSRPCSNSRLGIKPSAKVEFVLMPRETETNLWGFPDKQRVDTEDIRTEDVNEWIGETRITHT